MNTKDITDLQLLVKGEILKKGGRIAYEKELGKLAVLMYKLNKKEPVINLEALLLGEKIGFVIGHPPGYERIVKTDKYKIFHITDFNSFRSEFEAYIKQKLN